MHIWTIPNWQKYYNSDRRAGLRFVFDKDVDPEVRRACKEFGVWLRKEYYFPIRVPVYVKSHYRIKARDGEIVTGACFQPHEREEEPYIRIAAGDYIDLINKKGKDNALGAMLGTIAHELTHYFQWINDIELTEIGVERQAKAYEDFIIDEYKDTREHP
jgi:hypothetical protein